MAVVYGPQTWPTTFSQTGTATSLSGYPDVVFVEDVETVEGGGPNGERIMDAVGGDYAAAAYTEANFGPLAGKWSLLGDDDGPGYYYFGDWQFSAAAEAANSGESYAFTFGHYTAPNSYSESFALRIGDGGIHIKENGVETTVGSATHDDAWHRVSVYILGSSDGGFAADGIIRVSVDGTQIFEKTNSTIFVNVGPTFVQANYFNHGRFGLLPVVNFTISSSTDSDQIPRNDSTPCCADSPDPTGPGNTGPTLGVDPYTPIQEWSRQCDGGGTVPQAADQTDSESWAV